MGEVKRTPVFVHLLPSLAPPGILRGGVAVVTDVLRATTVMTHALAAGVRCVIPTASIEEARAAAASFPPGTAILAGERQGLPIPGFDLGNSPGDFTPERCRGKTLVMTTTNGTLAILTSLEADRVFIASFANLAATARGVAVAIGQASSSPALHIVCAGTDGAVSLEDTLLAGALMEKVDRPETNSGVEPANDSALLAGALWREAARNLDARPLANVLGTGRGGRRVRRIGLEPDIAAAAVIDRFDLIAETRLDPLRIEIRPGE